jgi:nucleoid-associated protein YgaU
VHVAGGPVPVISEQEVSVQRNDSLWSISREAYGTGKYVSALARYNRDRVPDPNKLRMGVKIRIPPPEILEAQFPELFGGAVRRDASVAPAGGVSSTPRQPRQAGLVLDSTGRPHYCAGKNDTLIQIARQCLGRPSRWTEILDMNRHQLTNAESLKPGMLLRMPADAKPASVVNGVPPGR